MKVFISWSGPRSRHVARALHDWLPDIVQYVEPWMSHENIQAGARWTPEINDQLSQTKFGIICLTPENQHKPWLVFEAGALAKTVDDDTFVVPYLIDMDKSDVEGPLAQFQYVLLDEEGTFGLVQSINKVPDNDAALPGERLEKVFRRSWPDLKRVFDDLPDADAPIQKPRETDEILGEVLELVRDISRTVKRSNPGGRIGTDITVLSKEDVAREARELDRQERDAREAAKDAYETAKDQAQATKDQVQDAYDAAKDAHEAAKDQE